MPQIYDCILNGLCDLSGTKDNEEAFKQYLQSLKPQVTQFRNSFRNSQVQVNYEDKNAQAAYLITYYPQYAEMTLKALEESSHLGFNNLILKQSHLKVCLFGAGPAPEIIGILSFLKKQPSSIKSIDIQIYDIASSTWEISRKIAEKYLIPKFWNQQIAIQSNTLDFCKEISFLSIRNNIRESHLLIFQNCINELKNIDNFLQNINFLIEEIPAHSQLIIADLKYGVNANTKAKIEKRFLDINTHAEAKFLKPMFAIRSLQEGIIKFRTQLTYPSLITENLLTGKPSKSGESLEATDLLIPRKNVEFNFFSAHKIYSEELYFVKVGESRSQAEKLTKTIDSDGLTKLLKQFEAKVASMSNRIEYLERVLKANEDLANRVNLLSPQITQLQQQIEKLGALEKSYQSLIAAEKENNKNQVRIMQLAIIVSSTIGFLGLLLAAFSLFH